MISYQTTRKMKNQHLQNRKQRKVSGKVDEVEDGDVWICNQYKEKWDDDDENRWIYVIYVMQSSMCIALNFAMKSGKHNLSL